MKRSTLLVLAVAITSPLYVSGVMANTTAYEATTLRLADLTSTSTEQRSDTAITADVKSKFLKEKLFGDAAISAVSISVETQNGIVHLTGTADNQQQIDNAIKLSEGVAGVRKVVNDVRIKAPEPAAQRE
ncbi:BON domain-containing protein [Candidatus Berkiella aquae]|uniref:BON domain-containing protein n=1 Tax=Candidatus Berkiella aquae TaxID=295108 RepID=A0A0Q9YLN8_9GAMM|nr:BON domain-containing protein [Candidatus Berkiella aquae]MCS5711605.1 BON domain-containing protein [Candidatus Berkiella aquae]